MKKTVYWADSPSDQGRASWQANKLVARTHLLINISPGAYCFYGNNSFFCINEIDYSQTTYDEFSLFVWFIWFIWLFGFGVYPIGFFVIVSIALLIFLWVFVSSLL
jgi:hypothetical protein